MKGNRYLMLKIFFFRLNGFLFFMVIFVFFSFWVKIGWFIHCYEVKRPVLSLVKHPAQIFTYNPNTDELHASEQGKNDDKRRKTSDRIAVNNSFQADKNTV